MQATTATSRHSIRNEGGNAMKSRTNRRWTDQEILDALVYWAQRFGRSPKWLDWEKADPEGLRPTSVTVLNRCGSFTDALIMAGLEPNVQESFGPQQRFSRKEAWRLRKEGLSDAEVGRRLGVDGTSIARAIGPRPQEPRKPRTAEERREVRIAALRKALTKQS